MKMVILTKLEKGDFYKILKNFNIGEYKSHKYMNWILENQVYILRTNKGKYILKLMSNVNLKTMKQQLELIDFLYKKGIPVVKNIANNDGKEIIRYKRKNIVIQKFVEGSHPERLSDKLIKDIAKNIGKMHKILLKSKIKGIDKKNHTYKRKDLSGSIKEPIVKELQNELFKNLGRINQQKLRKTRIHGDISEVNLLVKNNKLKAIVDWDDSDYNSIVYEIAIFLAHSFVRSETIYRDKIRLFLRVYQKYVKLNDEEKKALYFLIKYRLIGVLYWYLKYIKIYPDKANELKKGIARSVARLENFDRLSLSQFMKFF